MDAGHDFFARLDDLVGGPRYRLEHFVGDVLGIGGLIVERG